jgi:hypothetical protein
MNSRSERKARAQAAYEQYCLEQEAEEQRVAGLSLYLRIEEVNDWDKVRDVLHLIAEKAGINEHS